MTGLDLESFLLLLRADLTTWMVLGLTTLGLAVLVWSSWRSRRALRNCLVLSLAAHLGLVLYGSTIPAVMWTIGQGRREAPDRSHIRQIRVAPLRESTGWRSGVQSGDSGQVRPANDRWDVVSTGVKLADTSLRDARPKLNELSTPIRESEISSPPLAPPVAAAPHAKDPVAAPPESRPELLSNEAGAPSAQPLRSPPVLAEVDPIDLKTPVPAGEPAKVAGTVAQDRR